VCCIVEGSIEHPRSHRVRMLVKVLRDIGFNRPVYNPLLLDTDSHEFTRINELNNIINIFKPAPNTRTLLPRPTEAL